MSARTDHHRFRRRSHGQLYLGVFRRLFRGQTPGARADRLLAEVHQRLSDADLRQRVTADRRGHSEGLRLLPRPRLLRSQHRHHTVPAAGASVSEDGERDGQHCTVEVRCAGGSDGAQHRGDQTGAAVQEASSRRR